MRLQDAQFLYSSTEPDKLGPCAAEVAFVGRSNVGKSSVLNALLSRKNLARVSGTPGKTRAINVFGIGPDRWVVDLPGYGYAQVSKSERQKWKKVIEEYLLSRPSLKRVFVLVDAEVGPTELDLQMVDWLYTKKIPYNIIANKADKIRSSKQSSSRKSVAKAFGLGPEAISWASAETGLGMVEIAHAITYMLEL